MKLAFADREAYYGDPLFVKVPADGLLSKEYAKARRALIREDRAWPDLPPAGDPFGLRATANGGHGVSGPISLRPEGSLDTSYVCVVDAEGNAFSATPSDPGVDSPLIPGVGCVVSPRGSQGWLSRAIRASWPGASGRVSRRRPPWCCATVAPSCRSARRAATSSSRPCSRSSSTSPRTAWPRRRRSSRHASPPGASRIPSGHVHAPGVLEAESRLSAETRAALGALGHSVSAWPDWDWRAGAVCCVVVGPDGTFRGGADPRRGALAIGW